MDIEKVFTVLGVLATFRSYRKRDEYESRKWESYMNDSFLRFISDSGHACDNELKADVYTIMKTIITIIPVQEAASLCCQRFGRAGNLRLLWRIRAQTKKDKGDKVNCHYNRNDVETIYAKRKSYCVSTVYIYMYIYRGPSLILQSLVKTLSTLRWTKKV